MTLRLTKINEQLNPFQRKSEDLNLDPKFIRYYKMLTAEAIKYAQPFLSEEEAHLKNALENNKDKLKKMNFVAIGGGNLLYYDLASPYTKNYAIIDPVIYLHTHSLLKKSLCNQHQLSSNNLKNPSQSKRKLKISKTESQPFFIEAPFSKDLDKTLLPIGNSLYFFLFNVISYLDNPIEDINHIIKPGDIVVISGWNMSPKSVEVLKNYFNYIDHHGTNFETMELENLSKHKQLRFDLINHFDRLEYKQDEIIETYIIYTKSILQE